MKKVHFGRCHICGTVGKLSYEHVPPRKCFNDSPAKIFRGYDWMKNHFKWPIKSGGDIQQQGTGAFTLCSRCNNNTGSWYGSEFVKWVEKGFNVLSKIEKSQNFTTFFITECYPLRFLKQVIVMMFSIGPPDFAQGNKELVNFVLNKESRELSPDYKFSIFLYKGKLCKYIGNAGIFDISGKNTKMLYELTYPPFGFNFVWWGNRNELLFPVNQFSDFNFSEKVDICLKLPILDSSSPYPEHYT